MSNKKPVETITVEGEVIEKPSQTRDISPHVAHLIFKNLKAVTPQWWAEIKLMLIDKNPLNRKFAIDQINKLQIKAMPTTLSADEGIDINIAVVNYGDKGAVQLQAKGIPDSASKRN